MFGSIYIASEGQPLSRRVDHIKVVQAYSYLRGLVDLSGCDYGPFRFSIEDIKDSEVKVLGRGHTRMYIRAGKLRDRMAPHMYC